MNTIQLARVCDFKQVMKAMCYFFPSPNPKNSKEGYLKAFEYIKNLPLPKHPALKNAEKLSINFVDERRGKFKTESGYQWRTISGTEYSMSFRKWAELATLEYTPGTLKNYTDDEILAFFLWEITYYGYEEKAMKKVGDELNDRVKQVKKEIKNGTLKTTSLDDFKKKLKTK